jgi:NDP-4-keto-2,6-dideoxyhexose 3-C-methyltransferase
VYTEIKRCRICSNGNLDLVVSLGAQSLTGVFPSARDQHVTSGPLSLVKCAEDRGGAACGLLQLQHSYTPEEMYGMNYGYRSSLNAWMVKHLRGIVAGALTRVPLEAGDLVLDIGSNDSTLLQGYPNVGARLVGIDPTGVKLREYYPSHIELVPDFFSAARVRALVNEKKAKIVTSIAMVYDLEQPLEFFREVHDILADDGIWIFEQSYMPTMLALTSYDTICHEHVEYYGLKQIKWLCDAAGLKIIDVELNDANGGSSRITAAKATSRLSASPLIEDTLAAETRAGLSTLAPYETFAARVVAHRVALLSQLEQLRRAGKRIIGTGASTKGNVILQYCGITSELLACIAEINADKFGCFTPGTGIPIVSEEDARATKPDYMVVLPWHFRGAFVEREAPFLRSGGKLIFPLPKLEIVGDA